MNFWNKCIVLLIASAFWLSIVFGVFPLWAEFLYSVYPQRYVSEFKTHQSVTK